MRQQAACNVQPYAYLLHGLTESPQRAPNADVTDLLLTHAHHDHMVNWTMFGEARIVIGAAFLPGPDTKISFDVTAQAK